MSVSVIIVAAGRGTRLGGAIPKQYVHLSGHCAIRRSVEAVLALECVDSIRAVIHTDDAEPYRTAMQGCGDQRVLQPVQGGVNRADSVRLGLESLADRKPQSVLIHDAARPFVSQDIITRIVAALDEAEGACVALPVVDALWHSDSSGFAETHVPREGLWRAQTPQGFRFDKILQAHQAHDGSGADDVAVAREAGLAVKLVEGAEQNYKITSSTDLERARADAARLDANDAGL